MSLAPSVHKFPQKLPNFVLIPFLNRPSEIGGKFGKLRIQQSLELEMQSVVESCPLTCFFRQNQFSTGMTKGKGHPHLAFYSIFVPKKTKSK